MQAIRDMDAKIQAMSINQPMVKVKTVPMVLMDDNLTKAKRALMTTKQLCLSGVEIQTVEKKAQIGREGCFNTDKGERKDYQEEQGVLYVVPEIQR